MNKIDDIVRENFNSPRVEFDGVWYTARPENNKKYMTSFWYRFKEALNVLNGKAETIYYYKQ